MEQPTTICLNCGSTVTDVFCPHCGQSRKTHRFRLSHLLSHDFLEGLFHLHISIIYTLRQLFTRPGHAIREYVEGKRVRHINYFSLLIITVMVYHLAETLTPVGLSELAPEADEEVVSRLEGLLSSYPKSFFLAIIPVFALVSWLLFRKAGQNYAEHLVLNTYRMSANLIINVLFVGMEALSGDPSRAQIMNYVLSGVVFAYNVVFFFQYFTPFYKSKGMLLIRSVLFVLIAFLLLVLGLVLYLA